MPAPGLHISLPQITNARQRVIVDGCMDMEGLPSLRNLLDRLWNDISARIVFTFEFDLAQLYLMNSTSISSIAAWVKRVKDEHPECRISFRTNPNLAWQRRALGPIRRLADTIVTIE